MRKRRWKKRLRIATGILVITFFVALSLNMFGGILTVAQGIGAGYEVQSSE